MLVGALQAHAPDNTVLPLIFMETASIKDQVRLPSLPTLPLTMTLTLYSF